MTAALQLETRSGAITLEGIRAVVVWLMLASGWLVVVEPAPFDLLFLVALALFLFNGLALPGAVAPMIVFLLLYNLGGFISFLDVSQDTQAVFFMITSVYMAAMAMFVAFYVAADPERRLPLIRNAWIIAGVVAALTGLIGYFGLFGLGPAWAPIGRAQGMFKDPNVLSTFLIPPAIFLIHGFLIGRQRWKLPSIAALLVILAALFLAFSRGAWINFVVAAALVTGITFMVTPSLWLRSRIVVLISLGLVASVALVSFLLSFEQVRELFAQRASLLQSYDAGEQGRFGDQLRSIPFLLDRPFGFGPTFFRDYFGNDPHNVYLNAFASYGWLGGLSYPILCLCTIAAGWKAMMTRTPLQPIAIAVVCPLYSTMLQGIQIDTDHWRHFYLLLGMTWGLYAATASWRRRVGRSGTLAAPAR